MQGKLVPQDPNDQPASELLDELRKTRLEIYENEHKNNPEAKAMLRKLNNLDGFYHRFSHLWSFSG
jgi:hypothetical protein